MFPERSEHDVSTQLDPLYTSLLSRDISKESAIRTPDPLRLLVPYLSPEIRACVPYPVCIRRYLRDETDSTKRSSFLDLPVSRPAPLPPVPRRSGTFRTPRLGTRSRNVRTPPIWRSCKLSFLPTSALTDWTRGLPTSALRLVFRWRESKIARVRASKVDWHGTVRPRSCHASGLKYNLVDVFVGVQILFAVF